MLATFTSRCSRSNWIGLPAALNATSVHLLSRQCDYSIVEVDGLDRERLVGDEVGRQGAVPPEGCVVPVVSGQSLGVRRGVRRQRHHPVALVDGAHVERVVHGNREVQSLGIPRLIVPAHDPDRGCHQAPSATRKVTPAPPTNCPVPVCVNANWIWSPLTRVQGSDPPTDPETASVPV